ncbi:autotransporter-associated beta strand repeat-containing protein [Prosthecobacter vanneervenii]|uniref:Autotransporter-associated beta strand protein n=1 Tax=Prosthecobacter vanneervenii TaxID=48466 RepID=A0A7W7YG86_9BACT|nr:autotransporter-associated beta strand repeat-containing protein [Prosthecobacter vanneervenii]MBB5035635.1 autotransporter-associated beta strand protein [Prosthecobacter vanneervenii]
MMALTGFWQVAPTLHAATLTWDTVAGDGGTITSGSGTWTTGLGNWNTGSGDTTWNSATPDSAIFSGGASIIGFGGPVTVGNILFNATTTLAGGGTLTLSNSTLTTNADSTISGVLAGNTGLIKNGNGVLTLSGVNTYTGVTAVTAGTLNVLSLADGGVNSAIGAASNAAENLVMDNGTLKYSPGAAAPVSTDRLFSVGTGGATIDASSGFSVSFTNTGNLGFNGQSGARTLTLTGSNTGGNSLAAVIGDNGGGTALTKASTGNWSLSGNNTYTGVTSIMGGTLSVSTLANGGQSSNLGAATNDAANLILNSTLQYTGTGSSTDRLFTLGGLQPTLDASGTGAVNFTNTGSVGFLSAGPHTLTLKGTSSDGNTLSAAIVDNGGATAITKSGTGNWVLTGANSYTGTTTISGGVLQVGNGGTSGALGTGAVTNNASLVVNRSDNLTISNAISGTGSFTQAGTGTTTLSGSTSYAGATLINAGKLQAGAAFVFAVNSSVSVAAGAVLELNGFSNAIGSLSGAGTVQNGTATTATFTLGGIPSTTFDGLIQNGGSAPLALSKNGTGTQVLTGANTYTGGTIVNNGVLSVSSLANGGVASNIGASSSGANSLALNGGTLSYTGAGNSTDRLFSVTTSNGTLDSSGSGAVNFTNAGSMGFAGTSGTRTLTLTGSNTGNNTIAAVISDNGGATSLTKSGQGTWVLTGANSYTGTTTISGGVLQIGSGGTTGTLGTAAVTDNSNLTFNRSNVLTAANTISGVGGVTQAGTGTTTLSGTNSYTGATTITGGVLVVSTLANGGSSSNIGASDNSAANLVLNGGTLRYSTGAASAVSTDRLFSVGTSGGTLDASGGFAINFTNTGAMGFNGQSGARTLTLTGNNANDNTLAAVIGDNGGATSVTKAGGGIWVLSGANTYTGVTTVSGTAVLKVSSLANGGVASSIGASSNAASNLVLNGGTLTYTGAAVSTDRLFSLGTSGITLNVFGTGGVNFTNTGAMGFNGQSGARTLTLANSNGGASTIAAIIGDNGGATSVTHTSAASTWALTGANTYTGATTVNGGVINVTSLANGGSASGIGAASNAATNLVLSGGTLQYTGAGSSTDRLFSVGTSGGTVDSSGTGAVNFTNSGGMGFNSQTGTRTLTLTGTNTGANTIGAVIGDNGAATALVKSGAGTWVLTGANSYTGTTTINAGSLQAGGGGTSGNLGTGAVTNNGNLTFNRSDAITVANVISGTGSVTQAGAGTTTMSGANSYSGATIINAGVMNVTSLANGGSNSNLGASSSAATNLVLNGGTLQYSGAGSAATDRLISVSTSGGGLDASGGGAVNFSNTGSIGFNSQSGARTLTLTGTNTGSNTLAAAIADNGGATALTKSGTGSWTLSGSNSYTGVTTINGGVLSVTTLANGGTSSNIGASTNAASNLVLNGGTLQYNSTATTNTDRLFSVGTAGGTISVPVVGTLNLTNTGNIGFNGQSGARTVTFAFSDSPSNAGNIVLSSAITDNGGATSLLKANSFGILRLASNNNTYTGTTTINGGSVSIGALGGSTGSIGSGNIIINGSGTLAVSRSGTVNLSQTISGTGGVILNGSAALTMSGTNTYTGFTNILGSGGVLTVSDIGNGGVPSGIGASSSAASNLLITTLSTLRYVGAGASTDRLFSVSGGASGVGTIDASGTGPLVFTNTGAMGFASSTGTRTLILSGTNTQNNTMTPVIGDNSGATALTKSGAGTWVVAGANSYTGVTTVSGGVLSVASLANGGSNSNLGASTNAATNVVLNGGTLQYTGAAVSTDRLFSVGTSGGTLDASGTGAVNFTNTGSLGFNSQTGTRTLTLTGTNTGANTLAAVIGDNSGATALTKSGAGTWVLTGANSYSGVTTVSGGVLQVGNGGTSGTLGSGSVTDNASLAFNRSDAVTVSNVISGTGSVVQAGAGTTTLSGANSYSGATVINAGILNVTSLANGGSNSNIGASSSAASNLVINGGTFAYAGAAASTDRLFSVGTAGATLTVLGSGGVTFTNTGSIDFNGQTGARTLTLANASAGTSTIAAVIGDNGGPTSVTKINAGIWALTGANTYTGATTINGTSSTILSVTSLANGGSASNIGASSNAATNLVLNGGTLRYTGTGASTDRLFSVGTSGGILDASGTVAELKFTNTGSMGFNGQTGARTLMLIGTYLGFNTVAAVIGDNGGATSVTKAGTGKWVLTGNNTYSGTTTISGGVLQIGYLTASGTVGTGNIVNNGILVLYRTDAFTLSNVISGTGSVSHAQGAATLAGLNTYTGTTAVAAGTVIVDTLADGGSASNIGASTNAANNLQLTGGTFKYTGAGVSTDRLFTIGVTATIDASGTGALNFTNTGIMGRMLTGTRTLTLTGTNTGSNTIAAVISDNTGATSLVKTGTGTWVLSGLNTYTGVSTVSGGVLSVSSLADGGSASNIGGATNAATNLVLNGGTLRYTGAAGTTDHLFSVGTGGGTLDSSGTEGITFSNSGSMGFNGQTGARTLTLTGTGAFATNQIAVGIGDNGGATSVVKNGSGTWSITGTNSYTGTTTINAGTLIVGANGILGNLGTGNIINNGQLMVMRSNALTMAQSISGSGNLIQAAANTLTLSGTNTYTGVTMIGGGGTLSISSLGNGGSASGIGAATNAAGNIEFSSVNATLKYTGAATSTDRLFSIDAGAGAVIDASGTGAINFTNTGAMGLTPGGASARSLTLTGSNTGNNTLAAAIGESGVTTSVSKTGNGTWLLTGANTYTGATTISGGKLVVSSLADGGSASSIGAASNAAGNLVLNSATLQYTGSGGSTNRLFSIGTGSGTLDASGTGAVNFTNTGAMGFNGQSGTRGLSLAGTGTGSLAAAIGDNGGATIVLLTGSPTWTLSGASTYTGGTRVFGGVLIVSTLADGGLASPLGASSNAATNLWLSGGTLRYLGAAVSTDRLFTLGALNSALDASGTGAVKFTNTGSLDLNGTGGRMLTLTGTNTDDNTLAAGIGDNGGATILTKSGAGKWVITGANTYTGATNINAGILQVGDGGTTGTLGSGTVNNSAALVINRSDAVTIANAISGTGTFTQAGAGTTTFSTGTKSYTGATFVNAGKLQAGGTNAFSTGSAVTVASGAVLEVNGFNVVVGGLSGAGTVQNGTATGATLNIGGSANASFDGLIQNGGSGFMSVNKGGLGGTLTLTGSNTYTGGTVVSAGTLSVSTLANGGVASNIGASSNAAFNLLLNGGTLSYTGAAVSTDRLFSVTTANGTLDASGTGAVNFTNTGSMAFNSQTGARVLTLTGTNTGANTIAAVIGDNGGATALLKTGTGKWVLTGNSSYTGVTTISGGVLAVSSLANGGSSSSLGAATSLASNLVIGGATLQYLGAAASTDRLFSVGSSGGTLDASGTGAVNFTNTGSMGFNGVTGTRTLTLTGTNTDSNTINAIIGDNGGATTVVKSGVGTWVLNGANTYTGSTTINTGVLQIGSGGTTGTLGTGAVTNNGNLTINRSDATTISNTISGSGSLIQAGSGTTTLSGSNSYAGATTVTAGVLKVSTLANGGSNSNIGSSNNAASNVVLNGGALQYTGAAVSTNRLFSVGTSGGTLDASGTGAVNFTNTGSVGFNGQSGARTLTLTGSNTGSNTLAAVIGDSGGATSLTKSGAGTWVLTGTNTYTGTTTISSGVLQVGNGGTSGSLGSGAVTNNASLVFNRSDAITVANVIGGSGSLTQAGSGTMTVSGANTYTGSTIINAGVLSVASIANGGTSSNLGASSSAASNLVINGGTLKYTGAAATTDRLFSVGTSGGTVDASGTGAVNFTNAGSMGFNGQSGARTVTLTGTNTGSNTIAAGIGDNGGATALVKSGTGTWVLMGANTYTGSTTINAGVLQVGNGSTTGTLGSGAVINNAQLTANRSDAITINNTISGGGSFTQAGTGTTRLSGSNSYTGVTTITSGVMNVTSLANGGSSSNIGASSNAATNLVINGGTLQYTGSSNVSTDRLFSVGLGSAVIDVSGTGTVNFTNTGSMGFNGESGARTLTLTGTNTSGQNIIAAAIGDFGGATSVTIDGAATWVLTGANTYTGATTLSAGVLQIGGNSLASAIIVGANATLEINGVNASIGSLAGSGTVQNNSVTAATLTLGGNDLNTTFSGVIKDGGAGALSLVKTGAGTFTLTGANTYNGTTTISAGELQVGSGGTTGTLGSGAVTNHAQLTINRSNAITLANVIGGSGSLTQAGAGTTTLTGSNSYSGSTTISGGVLSVALLANGGASSNIGASSNVASNLVLNGGTLQYTGADVSTDRLFSVGTNGGTVDASGTGAVNFTNTGGLGFNGQIGIRTLTLTGTNSGGNTLAAVIGDNGGATSVTKSGTGTWILTGANSYSGTTTINGGVLQAGSGGTSGALGSGAVINNAALVINRSDSITVANDMSGSGSLTHAGIGTTTLTGTNSYSGSTTISGGVLSVSVLADGGSSSNLGASSNAATNLVLNGGTLQYTGADVSTDRLFSVGSNGGTVDASGTGAVNFTNTGSLGFNGQSGVRTLTLTGANTGSNTLAAVMGDSGGATTLLKSGAGTWVITGNNTYTGTTTISAGELQVGGGGTTGALGTGGVINHGSLVLNRSDAMTVANDISGSGGLTQTGAGTTTLSGTSSYTGGTTINGGVLSVAVLANGGESSNIGASGNAATNLVLNGGSLQYTGADVSTDRLFSVGVNGATVDASGTGAVNFTNTGSLGFNGQSGARTLTLSGSNTGSNMLAAVIGDNGGATSLTKSGAGTWVLSGANTYTGSTSVSAGTLQIGDGGTTGSLSASSALSTDGTLAFNRSNTVTQGTDFANVISGSGAVTQAGSGTLTLNGSNTYAGATNVNAGTLEVTSNNALGTNATGTAVGSGGTLLLNNVNYSTAEDLTLNGSGVGGGGALRNSGTSTYSGQITAATDASINAGGGILTLTGGLVKDGTVLTITGGGTVYVSGTGISGASANSDLVVDGTNLVVSADSDYNGPTTVKNGAMLVANAAVTTTQFDLSSNSMLAGTGSITTAVDQSIFMNGTMTVGNPAVAPVATSFALTTSGAGAVVMGAGSVIQLDLFSGAGLGNNLANAAAADSINLHGKIDATAGGTLVVGNPTSMTGFRGGDQWQLFHLNSGSANAGSFVSELALNDSSLRLASGFTSHLDQGTGVFTIIDTNGGLAIASAEGQALIGGGNTVTSDLNGHLFNLRAGGGEEEESDPSAGSIAAALDEGVIMGEGDGNSEKKESPIVKRVPRSRQWEVFATVNYGNVKLTPIRTQAGVQVDSWASGAGLERHFTRGLTLGFALSFLQSTQGFTGNAGSLYMEGPALSSYVSYVRGGFWNSLLYSFGTYQMDTVRNPGAPFPTANGSTRAYTHSVQYNTGWNFRFQNKTLVTGPFVGVDYLHGTVDAYNETGGGLAALHYGAQSFQSLVSRIGWSVSKKLETSFATITPQLRLSYERQNIKNNNGTSVSLINVPFSSFAGNQNPGQDYLVAGLGVSLAFTDRFSLMLSYQGQFFRHDLQAHFGSIRFSYQF